MNIEWLIDGVPLHKVYSVYMDGKTIVIVFKGIREDYEGEHLVTARWYGTEDTIWQFRGEVRCESVP